MIAKKIDILNIFLIIISLIIAIVFPFKLFLFSYAFLGPLHYLTEINWLNKQGYFITSKNKIWKLFYLSLCLIITILGLTKLLFTISEESLFFFIKDVNFLLITLLFFSVSFILFKKPFYIIISLFFSILLSVLIKTYLNTTIAFLGLFIPTLIHVFIFTLFFMIYGAIKSKSKLGFFCSSLLILVIMYITVMDITPNDYELTEYIDNIFIITSMPKIINFATNIFGGENLEYCFNDLTIIGIKTQIFIAFAYTYHYLNWFSKTSIIGWKKALSKKTFIIILYIWIVSIVIYLKDYETGYAVLFILSYIHVLLEFPLNILTIKEVLSRLIYVVKPK